MCATTDAYPLIRLTLGLPPEFRKIEGASAGVLFASAMYAAGRGVQLDPHASASVMLDPAPPHRLSPVDPDSVKPKLVAASLAGLHRIVFCANSETGPSQAEEARTMVLELPRAPSLPAVEVEAAATLAEAFESLTYSDPDQQALAEALQQLWPAPESSRTEVTLWVEAHDAPQATRGVETGPFLEGGLWRVGDRIRICAKVDRKCFLSLVNIGTSGSITVLLPNRFRASSEVEADEIISFPGSSDNFAYRLKGPPGRERVIALASESPLALDPGSMRGTGHFSELAVRDIEIIAEEHAETMIARTEIGFFVCGT